MSDQQDWLTEQEDWLRTRTWDLYTVTNQLVTTLPQLEETIAPMTVADFLKLPAAQAMPDDLREAAEASLKK